MASTKNEKSSKNYFVLMCAFFVPIIVAVIITIALIATSSTSQTSSSSSTLINKESQRELIKRGFEAKKGKAYSNIFTHIKTDERKIVSERTPRAEKIVSMNRTIDIPKGISYVGKNLYFLGNWDYTNRVLWRPDGTPIRSKSVQKPKPSKRDFAPSEKTIMEQQIDYMVYENRQSIKGFMFVHKKDQDYKKRDQSDDTATQEYSRSNGETVTGFNLSISDETDVSLCSKPIAEGAILKSIEPFILDPTNSRGISTLFIKEAIGRAKSSWAAVLDVQIIGSEDNGIVDGIDFNEPDNQNEMIFGSLDDCDTIAVTLLWGIFDGDVSSRQIFEWDMVFNERCHDFGNADVDYGVMDLQAIATHEFGHVLGRADEYNSDCSQTVMYGIGDIGSRMQRVIDPYNIIGVRVAYGESVEDFLGIIPNGTPKVKTGYYFIILVLVMLI